MMRENKRGLVGFVLPYLVIVGAASLVYAGGKVQWGEYFRGRQARSSLTDTPGGTVTIQAGLGRGNVISEVVIQTPSRLASGGTLQAHTTQVTISKDAGVSIIGSATVSDVFSAGTATFTGPVTVPNGTAAAPALTNGAGEGIHFDSASNYAYIDTAGASQLFIGENIIECEGNALYDYTKSISGRSVNTTIVTARSGQVLTNSGAGASGILLTFQTDPSNLHCEIVRIDAGTMEVSPGAGDHFTYAGGDMAADENIVLAVDATVKLIGVSASEIRVVVAEGDVTEASGETLNTAYTGSYMARNYYSIDNDWALQGANGGLTFANNNHIFWSSTASYGGANDLGMDRSSAGVLRIHNGADTADGSLLCGTATFSGLVTVPDGSGGSAVSNGAGEGISFESGQLRLAADGATVVRVDTGEVFINGNLWGCDRKVSNTATGLTLATTTYGAHVLTNSGAGATGFALTMPAVPTGFTCDVIRVDSGTLWITPGAGDNFLWSGGSTTADKSLIIGAQGSSVKLVGLSASVIGVFNENGTITEEP